ncbi:MAG: redox-sensing transcriptional repressor Rex [Fimbriiglobus sp.]
MNDDSPLENKVSHATAQRLSQYLRCLGTTARQGGTISSGDLAEAVGVSAAQVRRDLAALGHLGQRGVGYDAASLATEIRKTLGIDREWRAVVIGIGNLARALLRYRGFREQGFQIVGLFDVDEKLTGKTIEGLVVQPISSLPTLLPKLHAEMGILTIPSESAQPMADILIEGGVRGLLNFAPVVLRTPAHVKVISVDLAIQLEQLAFQVQQASEHSECPGQNLANRGTESREKRP